MVVLSATLPISVVSKDSDSNSQKKSNKKDTRKAHVPDEGMKNTNICKELFLVKIAVRS